MFFAEKLLTPMDRILPSSYKSAMASICFLTDEQKEILLYLDSSDNNYPKNEKYHKIYQQMIKDNEWEDWDWDMTENKESEYIRGHASMWNGSINKLIERIDIIPGIFEIWNHGHNMVHMANHPEAVKFFIDMHKKSFKDWEELDEETKDFEKEFGHEVIEKTPYELKDEEFETLGSDSLIFENDDDYSYVKDKV